VSVLAAIPSPSVNGVHVGPLFVHAYGLTYAVGVLAAIAITVRTCEAQRGSPEQVHEVALWPFALPRRPRRRRMG
jgi:prolipoprotein diacylglyceryltransferase